jgi:hypothetical protein
MKARRRGAAEQREELSREEVSSRAEVEELR